MRLIVALCGVLAGAAALGFGWWGQQGLLFETKSLSPTLYVLVVLFVHLIALASIGGGMAVLVAPRVGRVAMLSSAVGWLLLIAFLGGGIKPVVALLMALSAAGGLGAFLSSVQTPLFRLERVDAPSWRPARAKERRPAQRPQPAQTLPPPITFEDHSKPFVPPEDEEDYSRPFVASPAEISPAIGAVEREDFFGSRRRSASQLLPPSRPRRRRSGTGLPAIIGVGALVIAVGGAAMLLVYDSLSTGETSALPATASVAEVSSKAADTPSEESSQVVPHAPVVASPAAPSSSSAEDRLPAGNPNLTLMPSQDSASASAPSEIDLADDPAFASSAADAPSVSSVAPIASLQPPVDAAMASLPPITPPSTFASPYDYCASVANTDSPDAKKISGGIVELTNRARTEAALPNGEVRWRCMESAVWVCVQPAGSLSCDKVPSATDRVLICAAHPDTPGIRNAGGDWSCNGFTPVVSATQLNAADRRGFDRAAWKKLIPSSTPIAAG